MSGVTGRAGGHPVAPVTVSVIIVSWQSERFLPDCLESLRAQTHSPRQVIVVDNGSTDASVKIVRELAPDASLIELGRNTGYCVANNIGLRSAEGDAVLFLNSDIILEPSFLAKALTPFVRDERIGSVTGKLLRFDGRTVDTAGQCLSRGRRIIERGYGIPDEGQFDEAGYVFSVCGAAALYRRRAIDDIVDRGEFFDPDFFAFGEDLDVGWRARNAGWRAWFEPSAVARHYRGGSATAAAGFMSRRAAILRRPPEIRYHILKNRYLLMLKNDRPAHLLRDLPFVALWEMASVAAALVSGPAVVGRLLRSGRVLAAALEKRRVTNARRGIWGGRTTGLPSGWAGERIIDDPPASDVPRRRQETPTA